MSAVYWMINICLLTLAVSATLWFSKENPERLFEPPEALQPLKNEQDQAAVDEKEKDAAEMSLADHLDALWQRTLFRPERTEAISLDQDNEKEEQERKKQPKVDMELVGVGVIGDKSAAVIRVKKGRRGKESSSNLKRNVYRVGATIQDTGYEVTAITLNEVTLARGSEERVLRLKKSDAGSKQRREEAVAAEKAKEEARKEEKSEDKAKEKPEAPKPPPPPPAPGGPSRERSPQRAKQDEKPEEDKKSEELTRRERIRRALEARRRILQRRREERQQQNN